MTTNEIKAVDANVSDDLEVKLVVDHGDLTDEHKDLLREALNDLNSTTDHDDESDVFDGADEFVAVESAESQGTASLDDSDGTAETGVPRSDEISDVIFDDNDLADASEQHDSDRIPDPKLGEISEEEFLAGGFSFTELARQRVQDALANKADVQQVAAQQVEAPFRYSSQGRVSGLVGALVANTILRIGEVASAGHGAITASVAKSNFDKSHIVMDQSLAEARVHLEALRPAVDRLSASNGDAENGPVQFEDQADQAQLAALVGCFGKAQSSAINIAKTSVQLGMDGDEAAQAAIDKLTEFREENAEILEKMRWRDESVFNNFGETISNCMHAITDLFADLIRKLGIGERAPETESSSAPRMV